MATMIPRIPANDISNIGERLVYEALDKQLPESVVVRYHFPFCWKSKSRLGDGEIDFVVIVPERGLMFIEVKSSFGFDCVDGQWFRIKRDGRREITSSPLDQVQRTKHTVVERIAETVFKKDKSRFPGVYAHLVVYPRGEIVGKYPTCCDRDIFVLRSSLNQLAERISSTFSAVDPGNRCSEFTSDKKNSVCDFFKDNCRFIQVIAADAEEDECKIEELTKAQYEAFQRLLGNNRVRIAGPAGSGKTMIAGWLANQLASEGKRVLFLCYNTSLERWLAEDYGQGDVVVRSYFSLCREWAGKPSPPLPYHVPRDNDQKKKFYAETAPNMFIDALGRTANDTEKFDVVVVDEAQDFHENWWTSVLLLLRDPDQGGTYIFYDPNQSGVYGHGRSYPEAGMVEYKLTENCRNTKAINQYSGKVNATDIPSFGLSPEGVPPLICRATENHGHRAQAVKSAVCDLLKEGFRPSQIAILSPFSELNDSSVLKRITGKEIDGIPVGSGPEAMQSWRRNELIYASTIKSFKGLEADCVVLADVFEPHDDSALARSDLYVACTRAKHRLVILPMTQTAKLYLDEFIRDILPAEV